MRCGALCAAALLVLAGGCSDDDADPDRPSAQPVLEVGEQVGSTCLQVDEALPAEVEELPVIRCTIRHTHEIYATVAYGEKDVYPGVDELEAFAEVECLKQFETFVGISAFDSTLSFSWLVPSLNSWNDEDDRDVLCVLADSEGAPITGSMKSKKQ